MRNFSKKGLWLITALLLALTVTLAACNRGGTDTPSGTTPPAPTATPAPILVPTPPPQLQEGDVIDAANALAGLMELEAIFPNTDRNNDALLARDGTLTIINTRAQTGAFPGIFHPQLSGDAADTWASDQLFSALVAVDGMRQFVPNSPLAPIIMSWDIPTRTVTFQMRDGVHIHWSDGVELTLNDLKYAYYFVSHPDYQGVRFDAANGTVNVVGARAYNAGTVDHIEGIWISNDFRTMTVTFIDGGFPPSALFGGILTSPLPRHHFEGQGIPVAETREHFNARGGMIGWGPFVIESIIPGEEVLLRANDNYWRGRPNVDFIINRIIPPELNGEMGRSGGFDIGGILAHEFDEYANDNNITVLGGITNSQNFLYFTLGAQRREPNPVFNDDGTPAFLTDDDDEFVYVNPANQMWSTQEGIYRSWVLDGDYNPVLIYRDADGNTIAGAGGTVRAQASTPGAHIFFVPRDDNHPITDARFRRAIGYLIDWDTLNFTIRNGFQRSANGILHPFNTREWIDPEQFGTSGFHPDRANDILDVIWAERGWPAWDPNGNRPFRQVPVSVRTGNPNDTAYEPFILNMGYRPVGTQLHLIRFNHYTATLARAGIMLQSYQGEGNTGFIEHNRIADRNIWEAEKLSPNDSMHMWNMSWSMGWNPNPRGLWGLVNFNLSNYSPPAFLEIFDAIESQNAWDADFLAAQYSRWNAVYEEHYPAVYDSWPIGFTVINNRIKNWSSGIPGAYREDGLGFPGWHMVGITATAPFAHQR